MRMWRLGSEAIPQPNNTVLTPVLRSCEKRLWSAVARHRFGWFGKSNGVRSTTPTKAASCGRTPKWPFALLAAMVPAAYRNTMSGFNSILCSALTLCIITTSTRADWPQYRGPTADGITTEKALAPWPEGGPKVLWKKEVEDAFASFAIRDGKAYYLIKTGLTETCTAIELRSGNKIWATDLGKTIQSSTGGIGPRTTPAIVGDKLYTFGTYLQLNCLNLADGKVVWHHDIQAEFAGQMSERHLAAYGNGMSPIVEGELVIVAGGGAGQTFLAFNKDTGAVVWKKGTEALTHVTPVAATIGDVRQAIFFMKSGLVSINIKTGAELWRYAMANQQPVCASPVVSGDIVYASGGYGLGAAALRIGKAGEKFTVTQIWRNANATMNHFSTPILKDGYLYGLYGSMAMDNAPIQCVELATGKTMWTGPNVGEGEVILVDNKIILQGSRGQLMLLEPNPASYKEISRTQPLAGRSWGFPAYSEGVLIYRTDKQIAALELGIK